MLKNNIKVNSFALILSFVNFLFYHYPFFKFVYQNIDYKSFNGLVVIISLLVLVIVLNAFVFYIILNISRRAGKFLLVTFFIINAVAVCFVNTYGVIIDESMIGNILNTNYDEASSFFSIKILFYLFFLGIVPSVFIVKTSITRVPIKQIIKTASFTLLFIAFLVFINATSILWIDKNSKQLGGLAMPWSYIVNIALFNIHKNKANEKEILLPNLKIKDNLKSVVVLVIGESARRQNFSLYGYTRNTNPLLSKKSNLYHFNATSCATYTTAGVKCILEHTNTNELYEILPNYLERNNVEVIWRTTNWGEPPLHIKNYQNRNTLSKDCISDECNYDELLINGLNNQILSSTKNKILIVLHTSTSHGPNYSTRYPPKFETFKPVCNSVELGNCTQQELFNAYDNTIVYTDYILSSIIDNLKELKQFKSTMIFVSDHGESLGEKNLYMHGLPLGIAPKEQYEIPFLVWVSDDTMKLKPNNTLCQNNVFHSVLNFLSLQSPIYNEEMNIYK